MVNGNEALSSATRTDRANSEFVLGTRAHPVHCGQASQVLSEDLRAWFRECLGCVLGRREFFGDRYFTVNVQQLSDVVVGWRHFVAALERHETIACLYVISNPADVLGTSSVISPETGVRSAISALADIMSTLSDEPAATLVDGGALNFVVTLTCPVTSCRVAFFDFDAVAFVPAADNRDDPLYDPLMSAPVPMVNINSDIYAFSMFTRDYCHTRFDCEITQLTSRERRYLFRHVAEAWQRMAERTINNYAAMVDQELCPTHLTADRQAWIANHRDPAFAELEKRPFFHEMPVQYTQRIVAIWQDYFDKGIWPSYKGIAAPGEESPSSCPAGVKV